MRRRSKVALAVAAVLLLPAPHTGARITPRLPAPIIVQAGSVTYSIDRDEHLRRVGPFRWPYPKDAACCAAPGVWFVIRHRHLVVGVGKRFLWRSRAQFGRRFGLGAVRAGSDAVAFTYDNGLYLAPFSGSERLIARSELPLGFTDGGLYTYHWGGNLLFRSNAGLVLETIGRPLGRSTYNMVDGSLLFLTRGAVMGAHGANVAQLATFRGLGLSVRSVWMQTAGPLLELQDAHRLVLLHSDGSVFASTPLPRAHGETESISSSVALGPGQDAVAFAADWAPVRSSSGEELVYLLGAGAHAAISVHQERVNLGGCVRWASLQWRQRWLLYSNAAGNLAVIDSIGARPAIGLGRFIRDIPGVHDGFSAYWAGQPPQV